MKTLLVLTALVALGIGAYILLAPVERPGTGTITVATRFSEAEGLEAGAPVRARGVTVGRVTDVALEGPQVAVQLEIDPTAAASIYAPPNSIIMLRTDGDTHLEILNREGVENAPTIADGARVTGSSSLAEELAFRFSGMTPGELTEEGRRKLEQAAQAAEDALDEAKAWAEGPEAAELRAQVEAIRARLQGYGMRAAEGAQTAYEQAAEEGAKVAERLRQLGETEMADNVRTSLEDLRRQAAEAFGASPAEPRIEIPAATPTPAP